MDTRSPGAYNLRLRFWLPRWRMVPLCLRLGLLCAIRPLCVSIIRSCLWTSCVLRVGVEFFILGLVRLVLWLRTCLSCVWTLLRLRSGLALCVIPVLPLLFF